MIRVLHIVQGKLYGGVETFLAALARYRELCPTMESEFALSYSGRLMDELTVAGVRVHELGVARVRYPLSVMRARRRLADLLRSRRFDVAVCHLAWAHAIFGPIVRALGLPLAFWIHGATDGRHWLDRWARMTPPDLAICASEFVSSMLHAAYIDIPVDVVRCPVAPPRPISPGERVSIRSELDTAHDCCAIIQTSRMDWWKGHEIHLRALARLRDLTGWTCWIAGGAQRESEVRYLASLKHTAAELGIADRVRFVGERRDIGRLLAAADIHCQPNLEPEPFGIAFVEALYAGLPVVATDRGGAREIIDNSCGILVQPGDPAAVANALQRLITDRGLRKRLGAGGPARAAALCDPGNQIARLRQTILRVVKNTGEEGRGKGVPSPEYS